MKCKNINNNKKEKPEIALHSWHKFNITNNYSHAMKEIEKDTCLFMLKCYHVTALT